MKKSRVISRSYNVRKYCEKHKRRTNSIISANRPRAKESDQIMHYELADIDPSMCSKRSSTVKRMSAEEPTEEEAECPVWPWV